MKYMLLIHQGTTPTPDSDAWAALPDEEKQAVYADYQGINETAGRRRPASGCSRRRRRPPCGCEDGRTLTTDGPFVETKEALGGYLFLEADDLDAAIELAARIPAARMGGAIEVRPLMEG